MNSEWPTPRALPELPDPFAKDDSLVTEEEAAIFRQAREALWLIEGRARDAAIEVMVHGSRPEPNAMSLGMVRQSAQDALDSLFSFLSCAYHHGNEKNVDLEMDRG